MEQDFNTLTILAEVNIAFVAFSAIVASLRVTFGKKLTPFQSLLVHFFTETGLLNISIALLPLVLWGFWPDEMIIAFYSTLYAFLSATIYLVFYIRRRIRIKAPTPLPSLLVMIGYGIWLTFFAVSLTGIFWPPSLAAIVAFCFWGLISGAVIFVSFLATFVEGVGPGNE
ncbi:MAG: hypothetical protein IH995_10665 [Proteobacteria bacterium]|nr:hypothetical protein [Pseudomonadota bacterium]